jgi:phosphopantetheine--protein transferase-like protein
MELKKNTIFVFVEKIENLQNKQVLTSKILNKINLISNDDVKKQEIAKFNLLDKIYKLLFQNKVLNLDEISLSVNGKPCVKDFCFSISHSNELITIGVSTDEIGIDIQEIKKIKNKTRLLHRILTQTELTYLPKLKSDKQFFSLWTKKESLYKMLDNSPFFNPENIETTKFFTKTKLLKTSKNSYYLTVASNNKKHLKYNVLV